MSALFFDSLAILSVSVLTCSAKREIPAKDEDMNAYQELKAVTDNAYKVLEDTGVVPPVGTEIKKILLKYGIKLRQRDGKLFQVNISIPTSISNAIVVGLRYIKASGDHREDHFLFVEGQPVEPCYGKKLEKMLPEYKGAHVQTVPVPLGN
jgi:hypothetical protein